jgi:hypothetical protein
METIGHDVRCEKCGVTVFDSLVQHSSYILRCSSCREIGPATSWVVVGPKWTGTVRVFRDSEQTGAPLLEGVGSDIWREIRRLAADGTTLVLR